MAKEVIYTVAPDTVSVNVSDFGRVELLDDVLDIGYDGLTVYKIEAVGKITQDNLKYVAFTSTKKGKQ